MKSESIKKNIKRKSFDILFLESRLRVLVEWEEYERAVVVERWISELSEKQR